MHHHTSGEVDSNLLQESAPSTPDVQAPAPTNPYPVDSGVLRLSHSQLAKWDRCRFRWNIQYVEGWKATRTKPYLEIGKLVHRFLQIYYLHLMAPDLYPPLDLRSESQKAILELQEMRVFDIEKGIQSVKVAVFLVDKYIKHAPDFDAEIRILAVEKHFEIPLSTPKGREFLLQGYIDVLFGWRKSDRLGIMDHKTSTRFITPMAADMDDQQPVYAAALRTLDLPISDIIFNCLNTYEYKKMDEVEPEKLFKRISTYRTDVELDNFLLELGAKVDDLYENRHNIYRNLKKDCESCEFQEPCLLALKGIPILDVLESGDFVRG